MGVCNKSTHCVIIFTDGEVYFCFNGNNNYLLKSTNFLVTAEQVRSKDRGPLFYSFFSPSACVGLKIGSFTPSCITGMRFAVLTGRADCHYLCLTSLPSDVSMLAYFNNISCCCRSRCYRDVNFQTG